MALTGVVHADMVGKVFRWRGGIYRAIYDSSVDYVKSLFDAGIVARLSEQSYLIPTEITEHRMDGYGLILEHEKIRFLTRPYMWTREFLRDAALMYLDMSLELEKYGLHLIDGHRENIFVYKNGKPIWVDFGSILPLNAVPGGGLAAVEQFRGSFLNFLYLISQDSLHDKIYRVLARRIQQINDDEFTRLTGKKITLGGSNLRDMLQQIRNWIANNIAFDYGDSQWGSYHRHDEYLDNSFGNGLDTRAWLIEEIVNRLKPQFGLTSGIDVACNAGKFTVRLANMGLEMYGYDLDEKALAKLFRPFEGGVRTGGSGLGLAISSELIKGHSGKLELTRNTPEGAEFRISLPKNPE